MKTNKQNNDINQAKYFFIAEKPFIASSDSESDDDDYEQMHRAHLIEKSLLTPVADQALGEWEKHTKV